MLSSFSLCIKAVLNLAKMTALLSLIRPGTRNAETIRLASPITTASFVATLSLAMLPSVSTQFPAQGQAKVRKQILSKDDQVLNTYYPVTEKFRCNITG